MSLRTTFLAAFCTMPAFTLAQETRQLDAHEHGVSAAQISIEGQTLVIDLHAPGMDIVGSEYAAESASDRDAVAEAIRKMAQPQMIVSLPDAAGCRVDEVLAHLHSKDDRHDDMDAHAEGEDHAHDHDADEQHTEDDHEHDKADAQHSEFHARYEFTCDTPDALTEIAFPFFDAYTNAMEIEAQYVTDASAGSAEITRDAPSLSLD